MRQFLLTLTALTAVLSLTAPALAQTQVFEQNVVITMGQRESQEDVRVYALAECKRLTLEKVGVYLQAETDLVQKVRESSRDSQSDTDFQKRLLAVTAGVTQTEVVGEWWVVQGTSLACSLTCRVTVDPDDIQRRIEELLKDKQKVEDQQELLKEVSRLREEMAELRQTLESAPKEKTEAIKAEVKQTVAGFTAADWVQLGFHSTDLDSQIVYFSRAIEIEIGGLTSEALISLYIIRAGAFIKRRQIDNAIVDCDRCRGLNDC